jgi:hypothetical protein
MALMPEHKPAPKATGPDADSPKDKGIAVGDVIDGWTVQRITNPTDVVIAQGHERRCVTLQELERAKAAAATDTKSSKF